MFQRVFGILDFCSLGIRVRTHLCAGPRGALARGLDGGQHRRRHCAPLAALVTLHPGLQIVVRLLAHLQQAAAAQQAPPLPKSSCAGTPSCAVIRVWQGSQATPHAQRHRTGSMLVCLNLQAGKLGSCCSMHQHVKYWALFHVTSNLWPCHHSCRSKLLGILGYALCL